MNKNPRASIGSSLRALGVGSGLALVVACTPYHDQANTPQAAPTPEVKPEVTALAQNIAEINMDSTCQELPQQPHIRKCKVQMSLTAFDPKTKALRAYLGEGLVEIGSSKFSLNLSSSAFERASEEIAGLMPTIGENIMITAGNALTLLKNIREMIVAKSLAYEQRNNQELSSEIEATNSVAGSGSLLANTKPLKELPSPEPKVSFAVKGICLTPYCTTAEFTLANSETPELKLRAIYDRVGKVANTVESIIVDPASVTQNDVNAGAALGEFLSSPDTTIMESTITFPDLRQTFTHLSAYGTIVWPAHRTLVLSSVKGAQQNESQALTAFDTSGFVTGASRPTPHLVAIRTGGVLSRFELSASTKTKVTPTLKLPAEKGESDWIAP